MPKHILEILKERAEANPQLQKTYEEEKRMSKYKIFLSNAAEIEIEADSFDVDDSNNLDMIVYDEEGSPETKACFREWVYVMEI